MHPDTLRRSHGLLDLLVVGALVVVVVEDCVVGGFGAVVDDPEKINCFGVDTFQIGFSLVTTGLAVVVVVVELVPVDSVLGGT